MANYDGWPNSTPITVTTSLLHDPGVTLTVPTSGVIDPDGI